MTLEPKIRGRFICDTLESIHLLGPQAVERIHLILGPKLIEQIKEAKHIHWAPLSLDVQLTNAIVDTIQIPGTRNFFRNNLYRSFNGPIFRTLIATGIHLLSVRVDSFLPWFRHGFNLVFKDVGDTNLVDINEKSAIFEWTNVPHVVTASTAYLEGTAGSMEAVFDLAKQRGSVELEFDATKRCVRFHFRWQ